MIDRPKRASRRAAVRFAAIVAALALASSGEASVREARSGAAPAVLAASSPGDTVRLARGVHPGPLVVDRSVRLVGDPGAVVDGRGRGTVITVTASGAAIESLTVRGSGRNVGDVDAGIDVESAQGVALRDLRIEDVLYGVRGQRAHDLVVERCRLRGRVAPRLEIGDGNGIHLWYCDRVQVIGCEGAGFLDCLYLSFVQHGTIARNRIADCGRYGLHTMYCQSLHLDGNVFTRNLAGSAIMFSNHLRVTRNALLFNRGPRTYGLLLRDCSDGEFLDNRIVGNTIAAFLDNSNRNRFARNLLENNGWGLLIFSSSAGNEFVANNFVANDFPVALDMKYTSNRFDDGTSGNYWSENPGYDLDGDGISDVPHSPVTAFAFVSKQYPDLTLLAKSPAVAALGVAERVFPALRPSEAVDRAPRIRPVEAAAPRDAAAPRISPAWGALSGFVALGTFGALGLARGRNA